MNYNTFTWLWCWINHQLVCCHSVPPRGAWVLCKQKKLLGIPAMSKPKHKSMWLWSQSKLDKVEEEDTNLLEASKGSRILSSARQLVVILLLNIFYFYFWVLFKQNGISWLLVHREMLTHHSATCLPMDMWRRWEIHSGEKTLANKTEKKWEKRDV